MLPLGICTNMEIPEPNNRISQCFAERIKKSTLPVPPLSSEGIEAFPITIEMNIIP